MKCKWCGKKMKWWLIFDFIPHDYCSSKCAILSANMEADMLRRQLLGHA